MNFEARCSFCGARAVVVGRVDKETNHLELGDEPSEWTGGDEDCCHPEYDLDRADFQPEDCV